MTQPLKMLIEEHDVIRKALEILTLAKEKLEAGERPPSEFFEKAITFLRTFVFRFHHFKEEYVMFERLAEKKGGSIDAQIESLRYQHERGRDLIAEMNKSLKGYQKGKEVQTSALLENLAAYLSLLRHHIHKEEHTFYPMVDELLSDAEKQDLLKAFKKEEKKFGASQVKESHSLVKTMGALL